MPHTYDITCIPCVYLTDYLVDVVTQTYDITCILNAWATRLQPITWLVGTREYLLTGGLALFHLTGVKVQDVEDPGVEIVPLVCSRSLGWLALMSTYSWVDLHCSTLPE